MSKNLNPVLPPPIPVPPPGLGTAGNKANPFKLPADVEIVTDEYATLPPILARVMRDSDSMAKRVEDACDTDAVQNDALKLAALARTHLHIQRTKLAAITTLVKTSESAAATQLMRAQTAHVEQQTSNAVAGLTTAKEQELLDIIARRREPDPLPVGE